ncbi:MAG: hypothetical protein RIS81_1542 [Actinomycetota bacterium]
MPQKLRGKWALGILPRNLTWIIKDKLAICERPGGRENEFGCVISISTAPHNLHSYEELQMPYQHRPMPHPDDLDPWLKTFYTEISKLLQRGMKIVVHAEEVSERLHGLMGGYIRWSGLVDDPAQAIILTERIAGRQLDPDSRELILRVHELR